MMDNKSYNPPKDLAKHLANQINTIKQVIRQESYYINETHWDQKQTSTHYQIEKLMLKIKSQRPIRKDSIPQSLLLTSLSWHCNTECHMHYPVCFLYLIPRPPLQDTHMPGLEISPAAWLKIFGSQNKIWAPANGLWNLHFKGYMHKGSSTVWLWSSMWHLHALKLGPTHAIFITLMP